MLAVTAYPLCVGVSADVREEKDRPIGFQHAQSFFIYFLFLFLGGDKPWLEESGSGFLPSPHSAHMHARPSQACMCIVGNHVKLSAFVLLDHPGGTIFPGGSSARYAR